MAGDWIPYELALPQKSEVRRIARLAGLGRFEVVGRLMAFWGWCSGETHDGRLPGLDLVDLCDLVGWDLGFWEAVVSVGWLRVVADGLALPNAERWLTKAGKSRLQRNRRQARWRRNTVDGRPSTPPPTIPSTRTGSHAPTGRDSPASTGPSTPVDDRRDSKASTTEQKRRIQEQETSVEEEGTVPTSTGARGREGPSAAATEGDFDADTALQTAADVCRADPFLAGILDPIDALARIRRAHPDLDLERIVRQACTKLTADQVEILRRRGKSPAKWLAHYFDNASADQGKRNGAAAELPDAATERRRIEESEAKRRRWRDEDMRAIEAEKARGAGR